MSLFKKPIKFPEEEEISRGTQKIRDNRVDGPNIEMIRSACNSITHRPLLADQDMLQIKSGLNLQGKKRILLTFVLDCSMSMGEQHYLVLYQGISQLAGIMAKTDSMKSADISIITIEQSKIMLRNDFSPCTAEFSQSASQKCGKGLSPIVCAAYLAHKRGLRRKESYSFGRINCYRPITVVISDFKNNDNRYQGITAAGLEDMLQEMNTSQDADILKVSTQKDNPLYAQLHGSELTFPNEEEGDSGKITEWFHDLYLMLRQMLQNQDSQSRKQKNEDVTVVQSEPSEQEEAPEQEIPADAFDLPAEE